jgi:uroporphyrinogen decarboxylase
MRLIDIVKASPRRLVVPLAGYPGAQLTKSTIKQNEFNAELQARSLYKLIECTRPDMAFPMMDLSIEAGSLGLPVRFPLEESATVEWHPVQTVADLDQYKVIEPLYDGRVWVFVETVKLLSSWVNIPIGAYVIGPFTLAGLMMGATNIAMATVDSPDVLGATVNFCEQVVIQYAKALQEAGAQAICILDPTAVILSPKAFWQFAGRSLENVVRHLNKPTILHVCGNTTHLIQSMCETGVQGLSLDYAVSLPELAPKVPEDVVLIGNVDPVRVMLQGTRGDVVKATTELMEAMQNYPNFLVSTGCDLPAETPMENIITLVETVKAYQPR